MLRDATIRDLKNRLGDATYFGMFECAYPLYDCEAELRMLALERLSAIEEYVLRSISIGANAVSTADLVLGLGLPATRRTVAELLGGDLIQERWSAQDGSQYAISEMGALALQEVAVRRVINVDMPCIVDGVTGDVSVRPTLTRYIGVERVGDLGLIVLPTRQEPPTVADLDVPNMNSLLRRLGRRDPDRWPEGEVLDVQKLTKTVKRYRRIDVVIFRSREQQWICRVFERHAEQKELGKTLADWLDSDPALLPLDSPAKLPSEAEDGELTFLPADLRKAANESADRILELEEQVAVAEAAIETADPPASADSRTAEHKADLEQRLERLRQEHAELQQQLEMGVKRIGTAEHRPLLERAFKHAKEQVIVISPWITREAVIGEFEQWLLDALRRGVFVRIGWGFSDQTRDQAKEEASREMAEYLLTAVEKENRTKGRLRGKLQIVRLGNSHEKILIADSNFCVATSFNWLSFRGNRGKPRRETGARIGVPSVVAAWRKEFEGVLSAAAASQPS